MSEARGEPCLRCGIGTDDDGDGDCAACASASNKLVTTLQMVRAHLRRVNNDLHLLRLEYDKLLRTKK